jgi:diacylglycerol kinase (ATP)
VLAGTVRVIDNAATSGTARTVHVRNLTFIVNPAAGPCRRRSRRLIEQLSHACPDGEILVTDSPGQARRWAADRAAREDLGIIAVGGDGTVHEVVNGLMGGRAMLGVLPVGSGNDFAKMLDSPRDVESAVPWFRETTPRRADVGEVILMLADGSQRQHHFINGLGLGLEAAVAASARNARYLKGFARYLAAALWHLARFKPVQMQITDEAGQHSGRQFLVAIGNGRCAGGRFRLTPDALIDDGLLDICRVDSLSRIRLLGILPTVLWGGHGRFGDVHLSRTRAITIRCPENCMVHADGEMLAEDAVEIRVRVLPGVLPVLG